MYNVQVPVEIRPSAAFECHQLIDRIKDKVPCDNISLVAHIDIKDSMDCFRHLVKNLSGYDGWTAEDTWQEEIIYEFKNSDGEDVKCVTPSGKGSSFTEFGTQFLESKVDELTSLRISGIPHVDAVVSCVKRQEIAQSDSVICVLPNRVEIHYRKTFYLSFWKYTLFKCWSGATLVAVQDQILHNVPPYHRVSITCVNAAQYFEKHQVNYIAISLLLKISSLFLNRRTILLK